MHAFAKANRSIPQSCVHLINCNTAQLAQACNSKYQHLLRQGNGIGAVICSYMPPVCELGRRTSQELEHRRMMHVKDLHRCTSDSGPVCDCSGAVPGCQCMPFVIERHAVNRNSCQRCSPGICAGVGCTASSSRHSHGHSPLPSRAAPGVLPACGDACLLQCRPHSPASPAALLLNTSLAEHLSPFLIMSCPALPQDQLMEHAFLPISHCILANTRLSPADCLLQQCAAL